MKDCESGQNRKKETASSSGAATCGRSVILGVGFDRLTQAEAAERILRAIDSGSPSPLFVVTPNPLMVSDALRDPDLMRIINGADLVLADGTGILSASRRLGDPLPGRAAGIDTAFDVIKELPRLGRSLFILGGKPGRAAEAAERLGRLIPGLEVCGTADGYGGLSDTGLPGRISSLSPGLLAVCLGSPKQEKWLDENAGSLGGVGAAVCLGGAVDVWSGRIGRAPGLFIKLKLEWLWRMLREPSRLRRLPDLVRFRLATRKKCPD
ncbi:MAG: WecB/TagA/CpsF family glycosyltransferase [Clostridiales bacterium]|nr:WecB/TagA/CpsF family glycosyltransferase [Clostridiales bacterium]